MLHDSVISSHTYLTHMIVACLIILAGGDHAPDSRSERVLEIHWTIL